MRGWRAQGRRGLYLRSMSWAKGRRALARVCHNALFFFMSEDSQTGYLHADRLIRVIYAEFHGMDPEVLQRSLNVLVKRGKAQVFGGDDQQGVKFF